MERLLESVDALDSRQFEIAVKRLADCLGYGSDRSPFLGSGLEFAQSRRYVAGDPVRSIDWRVTARTGKYHVKEYETPIPATILQKPFVEALTGALYSDTDLWRRRKRERPKKKVLSLKASKAEEEAVQLSPE